MQNINLELSIEWAKLPRRLAGNCGQPPPVQRDSPSNEHQSWKTFKHVFYFLSDRLQAQEHATVLFKSASRAQIKAKFAHVKCHHYLTTR